MIIIRKENKMVGLAELYEGLEINTVIKILRGLLSESSPS